MELLMMVLGLIVCIGICIKAFVNYIALRDTYYEYRAKGYFNNIIEEILKPDEFFLMKNNGTNLCEPMNDIDFVDYISGCEVFLRSKEK